MSFLVKVGEKKMSPEEALLLQKAMMEVMDKAWAVPKSYGNCTSFQANEYKSIHGYGLAAFRAAMDPHWPVGVDPAMDKKVDAFRQAIGDRGIWICEIFKQYTDHGKSPEGCFCRTMDINGVHALSKNMDGADAGIKVRVSCHIPFYLFRLTRETEVQSRGIYLEYY